jgi:hypothetical protein
MIEFIFTIDYEIYGNGTGSLDDLIYEPARRLKNLFEKHNARFVAFIEAVELEKIEAYGTDPTIDGIKKQIRDFYRDDFEIALHLHPQWSNARYEGRRWALDLSEYNLCTLSRTRINQIVEDSMAYLRHVVDQSHFTPLSYRAGNWLFQPTAAAANVLAEKGIRIDSSVFKGGIQRNHSLDYRIALRNGYYWPFSHDVNQQDPTGSWIEVPIHTDMVPVWKMRTSKRMGFSNQFGGHGSSTRQKLTRAFDFLRFRYPRKLDFCRMTLDELTSIMLLIIRKDIEDPESYRPIVAIGHTKDLTDFDTVGGFLSFLEKKRIRISTFAEIYPELARRISAAAFVASSFYDSNQMN